MNEFMTQTPSTHSAPVALAATITTDQASIDQASVDSGSSAVPFDRATPANHPLEYRQLEYHRMGHHSPRATWWRPLTTLVATGVIYLLLLAGCAIGLVVLSFAVPAVGRFFSAVLATPDLDMTDPGSLAVGLGVLALLIPAVRWGVRIGGGRPAGSVDSVSGHFRWSLAATFAVPALASVLPMLAVMLVLSWWLEGGLNPQWSSTSLTMLVIILLLVPVQAAGEEYLFRGLLPQVIGTWLRNPLWGLLVSLPLFVVGHAYDTAGLASVAVFAAAATYVTWRTGGLEAAVMLHVVNNLAAFGLVTIGLADPNATDTGLLSAALSAVIPVVFAVAVHRWWLRTRDAVSESATPALPSAGLRSPR